jgi:hypothetical protein
MMENLLTEIKQPYATGNNLEKLSSNFLYHILT